MSAIVCLPAALVGGAAAGIAVAVWSVLVWLAMFNGSLSALLAPLIFFILPFGQGVVWAMVARLVSPGSLRQRTGVALVGTLAWGLAAGFAGRLVGSRCVEGPSCQSVLLWGLVVGLLAGVSVRSTEAAFREFAGGFTIGLAGMLAFVGALAKDYSDLAEVLIGFGASAVVSAGITGGVGGFLGGRAAILLRAQRPNPG